MVKRDPNESYLYDFDEQGTNEVSQQIMDSYNSGFINSGEAEQSTEQTPYTES